MSRDEVIENIGTIARSGTRKFLESLSGDTSKDSQLIGQFGVGFYSSFVVADRVVLETRRAGADATQGVRWASVASAEYSIESIERAARGTAITLHLKEGEKEFLDAWKLRELVRKYSEHIGFPIRMSKLVEGKPSDELETVNQALALWRSRSKGDAGQKRTEEIKSSMRSDQGAAGLRLGRPRDLTATGRPSVRSSMAWNLTFPSAREPG